VKPIEQNLARKFDTVTQRAGIKTTSSSCARFTFVMTAIYTLITCLVSFYKADFINLTVCIMAIYLLVNAEAGLAGTFRILVLMLIISLVYDILWFTMRNSNTSDPNDPEMKSLEVTIIAFSYWMAVISFFFKIVMSFVYWRVSLDFASVIDERTRLMP
jgi:hypothetical protein